MKKIYINGYFLTQPTNGVQRFAYNLLCSLDDLLSTEILARCQLICLTPQEVKVRFKNIQNQVVKPLIVKPTILKQLYWEQISLPLYVKSNYLINLCNFAPLFKKNQLVVMHDAIPFRYPQVCSFLWRTYYKLTALLALKCSKAFATVSNFSRQEFQEITKQNKPISIISNSAEHMQEICSVNEIINQFSLEQKKFILLVSSQAKAIHKNFAIILDALKNINCKFIAVGNGVSLAANLAFVGRISDGALKSLYENAFCFVYPSLYEGFGIPPLEAMICGCPVIVSDIPVMHEVCGDAALYFNPHDVDSLNCAINKLADDTLRNDLIEKGFRQAQLFSWQKSARTLLNFFY